MERTKFKKMIFFIGIDISKHKLDYAVMKGKDFLFHEVGSNSAVAIENFINKLQNLRGFTLSKALFCMEQTGFYGNHLVDVLETMKANFVLDNPLQIKNSMGLVRGKDDKVDSIRIAAYAQRNGEELKLWVRRRELISDLMNLNAIRKRLLNLSLALKTPLKEETGFKNKVTLKQNKAACRRSLEGLKEDLADIDLAIDLLIHSDTHLNRLNQLITSVSGVGRVTALQMIISTNEFKDIRCPKKFACYAGVAPFKRQSGAITRRARISQNANKKMKSLLHLCALNAVRRDEEMKAYYVRKTTEGKAKFIVFNAIRNKLIHRIYACINQDRCYAKANEQTVSQKQQQQEDLNSIAG